MSRALTVLSAALLAVAASGCRRNEPAAVKIRDHTWTVELATDPEARQRGLSGRTDLPAGTGMLFVFPRQATRTFYMRQTLVPLDIAFISSGEVVMDVRTMPVEADPSDPKAYYTGRHPAQYVLEVPAGELRAGGVRPGDRVELLGAASDAAKAAR